MKITQDVRDFAAQQGEPCSAPDGCSSSSRHALIASRIA
jgi:hypothetical protein